MHNPITYEITGSYYSYDTGKMYRHLTYKKEFENIADVIHLTEMIGWYYHKDNINTSDDWDDWYQLLDDLNLHDGYFTSIPIVNIVIRQKYEY